MIAPQEDGSGSVAETSHEPPQPTPITDQEVGEYREQDRFLPVCTTVCLAYNLACLPVNRLRMSPVL
jgi:hypothetical protein